MFSILYNQATVISNKLNQLEADHPFWQRAAQHLPVPGDDTPLKDQVMSVYSQVYEGFYEKYQEAVAMAKERVNQGDPIEAHRELFNFLNNPIAKMASHCILVAHDQVHLSHFRNLNWQQVREKAAADSTYQL